MTTGVAASFAVEAVRVHHVDASLHHVAYQPRLLHQRGDGEESGDPVLGQRNAAVADLLDEGAQTPQACHFQGEPLLVEGARERDRLILGAAAQQSGHDLQETDRRAGLAHATASSAPCSDNCLILSSVRHVFLTAIDRPPTHQK